MSAEERRDEILAFQAKVEEAQAAATKRGNDNADGVELIEARKTQLGLVLTGLSEAIESVVTLRDQVGGDGEEFDEMIAGTEGETNTIGALGLEADEVVYRGSQHPSVPAVIELLGAAATTSEGVTSGLNNSKERFGEARGMIAAVVEKLRELHGELAGVEGKFDEAHDGVGASTTDANETARELGEAVEAIKDTNKPV